MKNVDATEVRRNFAEVADQVRVTGERVVVLRNGRPLVAIVPVEDAQNLHDERRRSKARSAFNRASIERLLDRAQNLPIRDARSMDEILGYDENGLPS
jgi:prevent-host-death family protein